MHCSIIQDIQFTDESYFRISKVFSFCELAFDVVQSYVFAIVKTLILAGNSKMLFDNRCFFSVWMCVRCKMFLRDITYHVTHHLVHFYYVEFNTEFTQI